MATQSAELHGNLTPNVRVATAGDSGDIITTLCQAFDDDPVMNYTTRQDARRAQGFETFFRISLETYCLPHGQVFVAEDNQAAALWVPPGRWHLGSLQQMLLLPAILRVCGIPRMSRALRMLGAMDKAHPHEPHYYLLQVGVRPALQGRGIGSAVLGPILERCDREGVPAYLENSKEKNLVFYKRHGFEVVGQIDIGGGAPLQWCMWRPPQPPL